MAPEIFEIVKNFSDNELNAYFLGWAAAAGFVPSAEDIQVALADSKEGIAARIEADIERGKING